MPKEFNGRLYKTKNYFKEIVLYAAITTGCVICKVWLGVAIFAALTVLNIFLQIKRGGSIEDSIFKQGYYQYKQSKNDAKFAEVKRQKDIEDAIEKIETEFDDSEIEEELAMLDEPYENERTE